MVQINIAADKAIRFLLSEKQGNWWNDFRTLAGISDEWVTAYTACSLALTESEEAKQSARQSLSALTRRRIFSKGWGYNRRVPSDSDSTAWTISLHEIFGKTKTISFRKGLSFLEHSTSDNGGVRTYGQSKAIRMFTGISPGIRFDGWCSEHVCVTSVAAALEHIYRKPYLIEFIRFNQQENGSWNSYWWTASEYATLHAVRALLSNECPCDNERLGKAFDWMQDRFQQNAESLQAFQLAMLAEGLSLSTNPEHKQSAKIIAERLIQTQWPDGSWSSSAQLRIPPPDVRNPEEIQNWTNSGGGGSIITDQRSVFTTATVLRALTRLKQK